MTEPSRPTAATARWKWATVATVSLTGAGTIVYVTELLDMGPSYGGFLMPRIMQLVVYLSAIGTGVTAGVWMAAEIRAHIDERVFEVAARMDRRMNTFGNAMIEHGIALDDTTGEIARVRQAITHHTHPELGLSAKVQRITARAVVAMPDTSSHGLDPAVLEMGDRIARRLTDGN